MQERPDPAPPEGKARVRAAFGAASGYDAHARVQRHAARALANRIARIALPEPAAVLEIGCGTGLLTAPLRRHLAQADWIATDLAPDMLSRCAERIGDDRGVRYRVMDGEQPDPAIGPFDLICSSFAFQWFADLPAAIARLAALLRPGGMLAFAMPARDSLAEWRIAHRAATGTESAIPSYPSPAEIAAMAPAGWPARIEYEHFRESHGDARGFLAALRAIGAHRPRDPRPPLPPAALRRVMAAFDDAGARSTWQVAYALFGPAPESVREPRN